MVKKGKVRICITIDEFVYKKLCYECDKSHYVFPEHVPSKSKYINDLIDANTKFYEITGLVKE